MPVPNNNVSYSRSDRSLCKFCKSGIPKGALRLGIAVHSRTFDGSFLTYYHTSCYFKRKTKKQVTTADLDGFKSIRWSDQNKLKKLFGEPVDKELPEQTVEELALKWRNKSLTPPEENELDWKIREIFDNQCSIAEAKEQLLINSQPIGGGDEDVLRRIGQDIVYGCPQRCPTCKEGHLHFDEVAEEWVCKNYADAWSICPFKQKGFKDIETKPFIINYTKNKVLIELAKVMGMAKPKTSSKILEGLQVAISGRIGRTKQELIDFLEHHSAIFNPALSEQTNIFICSENTFYKGNSHIEKAKQLNIPVVSEKFLDDSIVAGKILNTSDFLLDKPKQDTNGEVMKGSNNTSSSSSSQKENIDSGVKQITDGIASTSISSSNNNKTMTPTKKQRKRKSVTTKVMPTTLKALQNADPNASIGVALAQSFFTPEGLPKNALIDVTRFNIHYNDAAEDILSTRNLARGMVAFDPICTDEGLNSEFEAEEEEEDTFAHAQVVEEVKKKRKLVEGKNFTVISKKYVDADSGVSVDKHHIYEENDGQLLYNVTLNQSDIKTNSNSYYIMQLLAPDSENGTYKIWFKWGRVGTSIGGTKLGKYPNIGRALKEWSDKFYAKTRNRWNDFAADRFVKYGGAYFPITIHYEEEEEEETEDIQIQPSKLPPAVQNLVKLIFDTSTMQKAMADMKLDMEKMPLGKLSKSNIQLGFSTLSEIDSVLKSTDIEQKEQKLLSLTNKFYTIVPHNFGKNVPPIIDNNDLLRQKLDMLQTLTDIEIANSLMKERKKSNLHPLDCNYASLNNQITPLDTSNPNYDLVVRYLKAAHSHRHSNFNLNVKQIYKLNRNGEEEKFRKHDCLRNHTLLWHGSRLSNWVGILSQGLRIAPPEAPHSGYKFGKGVYHANMASMSAEYCFPESFDNQLLLLVSEVALGEQYIQETPKYLTKEDINIFGKHSVLALGQYSLDSSGDTYESGSSTSAVVPLGKETHTGYHECPQDHPEFVVYDTTQVKMRYLLHLEFEKV